MNENKRGRPRKNAPESVENVETVETVENVENVEVENTEPVEPVAEKTASQKLSGANVSEKALLALGGGVFPFSVLADNITQSAIALPEINTTVDAYAKDVELTFLNERALNIFVTNFHYFTTLWGWNDEKGLILKGK
ncbi:MAG: hypothetical protein IJR46_08215 [Neisseriaceae bacterium]|nr:hypothetical protein [Neisseriaceae bacterium]